MIFAQAVSSTAEASGSASGCMDTTVEPYTASVGDQALLAPAGALSERVAAKRPDYA